MRVSGAMNILVLVLSLCAVLSHHQGARAVRSPGGEGGNTMVAKRNNWWTKRALLPTADQVESSLPSSLSGTRPIDHLQSNNAPDVTALDFCESLGYFGKNHRTTGAQGSLRTVILRPNVACICADAPGEDVA
ncbi:uncharacterized protein LOC143023861 [Oratosquilla oratoria]|uniref:uncharacterized protein LOC143023861 n=1 Tax=Oratosquilla oratoria TaxID=337810 RepID=UPI003F75CD5A